MSAARGLVFDFNGTLSHDDPVLYARAPCARPEVVDPIGRRAWTNPL